MLEASVRSRRTGRRTSSAASHVPAAASSSASAPSADEPAVQVGLAALQRPEPGDDLQPGDALEVGIAQRRRVGAVALPAALERLQPEREPRAPRRRRARVQQHRGPDDEAQRRRRGLQRRVEPAVVLRQAVLHGVERRRLRELRGALQPVVERGALGGVDVARDEHARRGQHRGEDEHDAEREATPEALHPRSGSQDEPDPAHGVQHARLPARLELAPQVADEDVGDVRPRVERVAPDLLVQPRAVEHLAGVAQQQREQVELARGELELAVAAVRACGRAGPAAGRPRAARSPLPAGRRRSSACSRAATSSSANGLTT